MTKRNTNQGSSSHANLTPIPSFSKEKIILNLNHLCLSILFIVSSLGYSQTEIDSTRFTVILDGNFGLQSSGHHDFKKNVSRGQELLGGVGKDGDFGERFLAIGEIGLEAHITLKNGLLFRADYHKAKSLYTYVDRLEENEVEGKWLGQGKSFGLGYGVIMEGQKTHFFFSSLSLGSYQSNWEFLNEGFEPVEFGNVYLEHLKPENFSSENLYLDFNFKVGSIYTLGKRLPNYCLNSSFTMGYRQGITKGNWIWEETSEAVQDINRTLFMGLYFKFCLGIGYISW